VRLKRLRHKRRHGGALPVADSSLLLLIGMCPLLEELHLVDKAEFDGSGVWPSFFFWVLQEAWLSYFSL
jgi:hypothetical protein